MSILKAQCGLAADADRLRSIFIRNMMRRTFVKSTEKLELAQWMRDSVVPVVRARGKHHTAEASGPAHWRLETSDLMLVYTEGALLSPGDRSLSSLLDVWTSQGKKMLSLAWERDRPWQPVDIIRLAPGPWLQSLESLVKAET